MPSGFEQGQIRTAALVVAAGSGTRAGLGVAKQYAMVAGKPLLQRTLEAWTADQRIDAVQVVIGPEDGETYGKAVQGFSKLLAPVTGGLTRQRSVLNGLDALAAHQPQLVLVHDCARPFATSALLDRIIAACDERHGAIPVLPVTDSLKRVEGGMIAESVARDGIAAAQTPQGFPYSALLRAHRYAAESGRDDLTDDAAVAALAGIPIRAVPGEPGNVKLTYPADFAAAEQMLAPVPPRETRTAQGFDVHAFGPGSSVWLCGIEVPHECGLIGHSDADAGLHAVTDALLGTIGNGDIGQHFPPSDPQWKGASSDRFLRDAVRRVLERNGRIVHLDVTLVCERPKVGPHREEMRQAVAHIAGISVGRVSVKATTSERLGFTGRGEGIAAFALATVELPATL